MVLYESGIHVIVKVQQSQSRPTMLISMLFLGIGMKFDCLVSKMKESYNKQMLVMQYFARFRSHTINSLACD